MNFVGITLPPRPPFHLLRPDELQVSPQPGFRMAVIRLSSWALPMGTKGWPRRFRTDPNVVSQ
jgi:hypothetical protein